MWGQKYLKWSYTHHTLLTHYLMPNEKTPFCFFQFGLSARSDNNPYQEWAGGLLLAWRLVTLIYALYELRSTYLQEDDPVRIRLYIVFLVGCLIWFMYLPIVVIIAAVLNPVYRTMLISTSIRVMDFAGFLSMTILLYPQWSHRYFQFSHWFTEDEVARLI